MQPMRLLFALQARVRQEIEVRDAGRSEFRLQKICTWSSTRDQTRGSANGIAITKDALGKACLDAF